MKEIILKYYLPVFGMTLVPILPAVVLNFNLDNFNEMILWLSILSFLLTLILGTYQYKFGAKFQLKSKKKQIQKDLFQQFIYKGFTNNEVSISGYFNDYYVIISPEKDDFQPRKWLEILILFNPKQQDQFITSYTFEKLFNLNRKDYSWNSNSLTIKKVYGFNLPKYKNVKEIIERAINDLKINNIYSISLDDWNLS